MSRVANLSLGLMRRTNDSLATVDPAALARSFNLPVDFATRLVAEEIKRRAGA